MSADAPAGAQDHGSGTLYRLLRAFVHVEPREVAALIWAWVYFFCVLSAYYVIRPIRDDVGVAGGIRTCRGSTSARSAAWRCSIRRSRRWSRDGRRSIFVPRTYRFFVANLLDVLRPAPVDVGRSHTSGSAACSSCGPRSSTCSSSRSSGPRWWTCSPPSRARGSSGSSRPVRPLARSPDRRSRRRWSPCSARRNCSSSRPDCWSWPCWRSAGSRTPRVVDGATTRAIQDAVIGGGTWDGLARAWRSPYLLQICLYMLLFTTLPDVRVLPAGRRSSTSPTRMGGAHAVLRQGRPRRQRAHADRAVVPHEPHHPGRGSRCTRSPCCQPSPSSASSSSAPCRRVAVIVAFQIIRRATEFALARPTRELLYSVVAREDKYKAKSFIDTFVYRAGDQVGAWTVHVDGRARPWRRRCRLDRRASGRGLAAERTVAGTTPGTRGGRGGADGV